MAISKLNAEQYANLASNATGILLVYAGKEGKDTAMHFFGADFEAADKTQDELFRVLRNLVATHWNVKSEETKLREANDGIRSKLRASTPAAIIVRSAKGETIKHYDLDQSVWARIGLMPTKKDVERSARDQKTYQHNATKAMMDALGFRLLPVSNETPAVTEMPAKGKTETKKAA
jgi:hypothetical protein